MEKRLLTIHETGVFLGLSDYRTAELIRQNAIPGKVELGLRTVKIDRLRLEEFIDAGGLRTTEPLSRPVEKRSGIAKNYKATGRPRGRPRKSVVGVAPAVTAGTVDARA
jgi:hypothetical protein